MGESTRYCGMLGIEPPLIWSEIQDCDAWEGHADHAPGIRPFGGYRYGTRLVVTEQRATVESGEYAGQEVIVRLADAVKIVGDELRHGEVMDSLRRLARRFGETHRFTGRLYCRHEHPDVETPFQIVVEGTEAREVWPVMLWPGDGPVKVVAAALMRSLRSEPGEAAELAELIVSALADVYTVKG